MPSPGDNEVELIQQKPLGNELPEMPPHQYPSAPEPEPSGNLGSDSQPNLPPPTYEEAIDPTFMQRFQKFAPQWPGFHPAEVPRLTRQMTRQMSRNGQDPDNEAGETNAEEEKEDCCFTIFSMFIFIVMIFSVLGFLLGPIAMTAVGSYYFEECDIYSPYPLWLIVGGVSTMAACLFICCLSCADTENNGLYCCAVILLVVPVIWFFFGCYYVWGLWDRHGNLIYGEECGRDEYHPVNEKLCGNLWPKWELFEQTNCVYPYYFAYALVVAPFALIGLVFVVFCGMICCYALYGGCCEDD